MFRKTTGKCIFVTKENDNIVENKISTSRLNIEKNEQKGNIYDDGTLTFFWRAHTLTVLFLFLLILVYVAIFEPINYDSCYNIKRGLIASVIFFILLGVTVTPDGPFVRPHPVLWRATFCCSIIYELALIFLLFQTPKDARTLLIHISSELGKPLNEKDYGGNCKIFDSENPNPFHNVWMDLFVPCHLIGWYLKMLILRDWWLCIIISVSFELLEYTLEHQLPNFHECWWDHWILDALLCNGIGMIGGYLTLYYFSMKTYYWRGLWNIPTYRGKLRRILEQFGPYSWVDFDWQPTSSLSRWLVVLSIIALVRQGIFIYVYFSFIQFLLAELCTFYLKFVLWIPPDHYLNFIRLFFLLLWGAVSLRETFQYLTDTECITFGRQSWMLLAILITEFLVILRFGWDTASKPLPLNIACFWLCGIFALITYTVWMFFPIIKVHT